MGFIAQRYKLDSWVLQASGRSSIHGFYSPYELDLWDLQASGRSSINGFYSPYELHLGVL
jgi:hypothetical protein